MATKEQLESKTWHNIRQTPYGMAGDSDATEPGYTIVVGGQGEAVDGATITHYPGGGTSIPIAVPLTTIPTPVEAAAIHEQTRARQKAGR